MHISRIDHVGIAVADVETALAFYTGTLGLIVVHEEENVEQGVREIMLAPEGNKNTSATIQLLAPLHTDTPIAKFLDNRGPGLQQVAFQVDDLIKTMTDLRNRGVRLLYDEPKQGTAGSQINFIHPADASGVLIELVQP